MHKALTRYFKKQFEQGTNNHSMCRLKEHIFYSNYFYGLCAVALSAEAMLQQRLPLNSLLYFVFAFFATVLFYSYPYVRKCNYVSANSRTNWYTNNYKLMRWNQLIITVILLIGLVLFSEKNREILPGVSPGHWLLIFIFPVVGALYYGGNFIPAQYNLRKIGWLKPFIIGFIWSGMVTVYPVLFYAITNNQEYNPGWIETLLFLKNFMFISLLCIMFDIKDHAADHISRLKTFIVKMGLRKTIFFILLPPSVIGLGCFLFYASTHQFHAGKIILNTIPFLLLIAVGFSLRRRRPLMYYLTVIDGLMIAKALCGIAAMLFF